MITVITFGTFDLLHIGHVRILHRSRALGDRLIVGVSSDALNILKKNKPPVYSQTERMEIISSIDGVDEVFLEESLEQKRYYVQHYNGDVLAMGDDWVGRFDYLKDICKVIYLPRTPIISTTSTLRAIRTVGN